MSFDFYLWMKFGGAAVFIAVGAWFVSKRLKTSYLLSIFINSAAVAVGFAASRTWHIAQESLGPNAQRIYSFRSEWNSAGSVLYGWILGGALAIYFLAKVFKLSPFKYLDAMTPFALIGQLMNRFGCFEAGCCYGRKISQDAFQKLSEPLKQALGYGALHPVQLYEALADLILLTMVWLVLAGKSSKEKPGTATFAYFGGYAIARFFLEYYRGDNKPALIGLTVAQLTSLVVLAFIGFLLGKNALKKR
jgi:prolipoprotein diacylglyceryltransferase